MSLVAEPGSPPPSSLPVAQVKFGPDAVRATAAAVLPDSPRERQASFGDSFWLTLTIVNVGLALWLLPDKVLKSDWLDLLGKLAPWLASSVFVAGYTWRKEQILAISRSNAFRTVQAALLVPLVLMEVPLLVIRVELAPSNAELWIDGERASRTMADWKDNVYQHEIRLSMRPHWLELKKPEYWDNSVKAGSQQIELGWVDIGGYLWSKQPFHWSLVWPVELHAPCKPDRIVIIRENNAFDWNYLTTWAMNWEMNAASARPPYNRLDWEGRTFNAVQVTVPKTKTPDANIPIRLPFGTYKFIAIWENPHYIEEDSDETISASSDATMHISFNHCG